MSIWIRQKHGSQVGRHEVSQRGVGRGGERCGHEPTSTIRPPQKTLGGKDFERADAQGLMKGSGIFLHNDPGDRPVEAFGGQNTIHTGGVRASYLLMPLLPTER